MVSGDKSTEELAKLATKSLETAERAGGWVDQVFGDGLRQVGQAFAESMAGFRVRNRLRVLEKTQAAIDKAGLTGNTRPIPERLAGPIVDAISDESDEVLQDVWAAYLSFSVDPKNPSTDRLLIDVIRRLEPADWPVLKALFQAQPGHYESKDIGFDNSVLEPSMDRFTALSLFIYDDPSSAYLVSDDHFAGAVQIAIGNATYYPTKLFRRLMFETEAAWR
jgi:hypothetical protein